MYTTADGADAEERPHPGVGGHPHEVKQEETGTFKVLSAYRTLNVSNGSKYAIQTYLPE